MSSGFRQFLLNFHIPAFMLGRDVRDAFSKFQDVISSVVRLAHNAPPRFNNMVLEAHNILQPQTLPKVRCSLNRVIVCRITPVEACQREMCIRDRGMALFFADDLTQASFLGTVIAIASGFCFGCLTLFLRKQKDGSPLETVLLGNILTALISIPFMLGSSPGSRGWLLLAVTGIFQLGLPYLLYTTAIRHVTALDAVSYTHLACLSFPCFAKISAAAGTRKGAPAIRALPGISNGAHGRNRTGDPILTMDVLCLLSYMGSYRKDRIKCHINGAGNGIRTRDLQLGRLTL